MKKHIITPFTEEQAVSLKAGDQVLISGVIYTARDAAHKRLVELLNEGKELPCELKDQIIYYVGPAPAKPGMAIGSAGPNPCPPIVVGVGIGGNFDKVALLAKKALIRPIDERNEKPIYAALENELLDSINALGIGPQGFGGKTTALGVNIEVAPTHIAQLPCAVNISCHVTRHKSVTL